MNASELVKERSELTARIEEINAALALLESPATAVELSTRRNLRNTGVGYRTDPDDWETWVEVAVYSDATLTTKASEYDHGGYITAHDAAALKAAGEIDADRLHLCE